MLRWNLDQWQLFSVLFCPLAKRLAYFKASRMTLATSLPKTSEPSFV
jgi:hypothetical protein